MLLLLFLAHIHYNKYKQIHNYHSNMVSATANFLCNKSTKDYENWLTHVELISDK